MKNFTWISVIFPAILLFSAISCSKDTNTNGSGVRLPCSNCSSPSTPPPKPSSYWHSIEINATDWFDTAGISTCDLDPKVDALFPWDYGGYTYPSIAFNYGTSTMQIINQGDSLARNGGLFFLKGQDVIFKSQTTPPPDTIFIAVYLQP
jgi:hypothetical protein